jgi:hypothetical protein
LNEHNERINLLSDKGEEEGLPACKICFRNTNVVTKCDNHSDDDGVVGCAFCALNKCPMCRNENVYHTIIGSSKKIKKSKSKPKAHKCVGLNKKKK